MEEHYRKINESVGDKTAKHVRKTVIRLIMRKRKLETAESSEVEIRKSN